MEVGLFVCFVKEDETKLGGRKAEVGLNSKKTVKYTKTPSDQRQMVKRGIQ
jgi:hypothetical protein